MATHEAPRVEVPKPHTFSGKRNAKELDNFLLHMELYFKAIILTNEAAKVHTMTLYLTDNANLWWCQRKNMKRLKYTCSIHEYVKKFSTLMLEIPNMSEEELLFNFMNNLQSWAEQELKRRGIQDLATTMAIVESLVEYKRGDSYKPMPQSKGSNKMSSGKDGKGKDKRKEFMTKTKCFLCDSPHWVRDNPKRKTLNAMIEEKKKEGEAHVGLLQLLNILKAKSVPKMPQSKGLIYVEAFVNEKATKALVDIGATHNFVSEDEAKRLEL
ncbi:hypothetical protein CK203_092499 [Vitis vinifera]|uniref:Retrotransposon gag domain-containing protein n=1 Tax=Vitis vinifera TaxID=29760 RepID=A0A438EBT0_VITVI|nr:hypothetical protein CK203_092499 [Vitis vinifera]